MADYATLNGVYFADGEDCEIGRRISSEKVQELIKGMQARAPISSCAMETLPELKIGRYVVEW